MRPHGIIGAMRRTVWGILAALLLVLVSGVAAWGGAAAVPPWRLFVVCAWPQLTARAVCAAL